MRKLLLALSISALSITAAKAEPEVFVSNKPDKPVPVTVTGETTGTITGDVNVTNDENSPMPVTVEESTEYVTVDVAAIFPPGAFVCGQGVGACETELSISNGDLDYFDNKRVFVDSVACGSEGISGDEIVNVDVSVEGSSGAWVFVTMTNIWSRPALPGVDRSFRAYQLTSGVTDNSGLPINQLFRIHATRNEATESGNVGCSVQVRSVDLN